MAHPAQQRKQIQPTQTPASKRNYPEIYDKIVRDSRQDPAAYIKRWVVPGGAE